MAKRKVTKRTQRKARGGRPGYPPWAGHRPTIFITYPGVRITFPDGTYVDHGPRVEVPGPPF